MKKNYTLFSREAEFYQSSEPGHFAAVTTQKIAGRLDCPSGKKAKPENRIFLRYLGDMPKGFRFCKVCKPEILQVGDCLDYLEARAEALQSKPHIALWETGIVRKNGTYEPCRWYVAMNWEDGQKISQITFSNHHRYHRALSIALKEGGRLNLPVVKHMVSDFMIIALPKTESTIKQKELVKGLQNGSVTSIFGSIISV